jgi:DNA replication protein DnaC
MSNTVKKNRELTLLQAIERVVEMAEDSKMSLEFMKKAKTEILLLSNRYGITERQAVLFCICMEKGPLRVDYNDFASFLDLNKIRVLSYANDIDALVRRRLLRYRNAKDENEFDIPNAVIRCLKHNEVYQLPTRTGLDCAGLFELLNLWFNDLCEGAISPHELREELKKLFNENRDVGFVQKMNELSLDDNNQLLLTLFCHLLVNQADDDIRFSQINNVFDCQSDFNNARAELRAGEHILQKYNLIEHRCEDGIADVNKYKLTENAKRNLLEEMKLNVKTEKIGNMMEHDSLPQKQLFFSTDTQQQVEELGRFLQPDNYQRIQERMKEKGFRNGFACLFYGSPGTGKTETVYQLARQTGRNIMVVDVPQIKSKWVGESEKNIKALFDRYRELTKRINPTPILLFNEADAIIGIRRNGADNAVDKMENSLQNIILQEMEQLDGIMIATTNLQQNMDKAFERRFLYKIKFEKPTEEVRASIWHSMIPSLNELEVHKLASKYDFSGGQIENVARRHAIDSILHDQTGDILSTLFLHCDNERLDDYKSRKIGF